MPESIAAPAPVSEENFRSTALARPTVVLVDRAGIVRMYHPGAMTYEELRARVASVVATPRAHHPAASSIRRFSQ